MKQTLIHDFMEIFGEGEDCQVYFAPGRVNLIGEHTDYNGGHVFPCALTLGTYAAVRKNDLNKFRFYSQNVKDPYIIEAPLEKPENKKEYRWSNYPLGVIWSFWEAGMIPNQGFDMLVWGNIPSGSGLSSSAALEVLTGTILKEEFGFEISGTQIALLSQKSENQFNGCNCGIMDQFASANGKKDHAIFLDTATLEYEYAPILLKDAKIVITNSKVKHSLVDSEYNNRRRESTQALHDLQQVLKIETLGELTNEEFDKHEMLIRDEVCRRRARHAVYENRRTIEAVEALKKGNVEQFGKLMNEAHVSMRDDYEASCKEVDFLVECAWEIPGVLGCRITGGGFGGCTVAIVKDETVDDYQSVIKKNYQNKYNKTPEFYVVDIGAGAGKI